MESQSINLTETQSRSSLRITRTILAACALIGAVGCIYPSVTPNRAKSEEQAPFVVFANFDASISDRTALPAHLENLSGLSNALSSASTWLTVTRFDSDVRELYSDPMFDLDEDFLTEFVPKLAQLSGVDYTYSDKLFKFLDKRTKLVSGNCVVIICTDGFAEGTTPKGHEFVRQVARHMAANKRVKGVYLSGLDSRNVAQWRSDLEPLGAKLHLVGSLGIDAAVIKSVLNSGGSRQ